MYGYGTRLMKGKVFPAQKFPPETETKEICKSYIFEYLKLLAIGGLPLDLLGFNHPNDTLFLDDSPSLSHNDPSIRPVMSCRVEVS